MDLYTIVLKRKIMITRFEGRRTVETTDLVEETYRDLPLETANRYKTLFPDADVKISKQESIETSGGRVSVRIGNQSTKVGRRAVFGDGKELPEPRNNFNMDKHEARKSRPKTAEKTGVGFDSDQYTDVINRMVEEAA